MFSKHPLRHEVDEHPQACRHLPAGRPQQVEAAASLQVIVEHGDQFPFSQLLAHGEVRQAGDATVAHGKADPGFDMVADHRHRDLIVAFARFAA
ncbi:hypothetical protein D3C75_1216320 [compost metagenome]